MKRYEFRMHKVLRVRRLQEDAARAALAGARRVEQESQLALSESQEHYGALSVPAAESAVAFLGLRERAAHRATGVRLAEGQRQVAAEQTAAAVATWHERNRRVDALERLDGRRRDEYDIERRRAEDATVDEIVVSRARRTA